VAYSTNPGSDGLCQHVLQPSGKPLFLIKNTGCFHACALRVMERRGNSCRVLRCWWWGAWCRALVAGSRNWAVPVAASGEAALRGAVQWGELLQL